MPNNRKIKRNRGGKKYGGILWAMANAKDLHVRKRVLKKSKGKRFVPGFVEAFESLCFDSEKSQTIGDVELIQTKIEHRDGSFTTFIHSKNPPPGWE